MRKQLSALGLVAAVALAYGITPALAYKGEELASNAKVSIDEARRAALKAVPGQITDEELEKEGGGSGLRYSFDILSKGQTHEVGVDANTGAILENSIEGLNPD